MPSNFTTGKGRLIQPNYGSFVDEWNRPMNSDIGLVDALVSGTTTLNVATLTPSSPFFTLVFQDFDTSTTPWLNPLAGQNLRIVVTGALAFNVTIYIPANVPGFWIIDNQTTGGFTVTIVTNAAGSVGVIPAQGYMSIVFCDGTNVKYADLGTIRSNVVPSDITGAIITFGGATAPAGYLPCNGAAVSRATYAALFSVIGTLWGAGDGSTTFNVPNLVDYFVRGASSTNGVGVTESDDFKSHTHTATVTDPGHTHTVPFAPLVSAVGVAGGNVEGGPTTTTSSATTGITVVNTATGGTETRPMNKRVNYIIKI
jgi:microcystin-dependent protein